MIETTPLIEISGEQYSSYSYNLVHVISTWASMVFLFK